MSNGQVDQKKQDETIRKYTDLIKYSERSPHWSELKQVISVLEKMEHYEKCQELLDLFNGLDSSPKQIG